jgi:sterol desaturase/sphingolipid hydroxylase (fatty acid hydroxylase superfamily)
MVLALLCFAIGWTQWSFQEYALHRWILHGLVVKPVGPRHGRHHVNPKQRLLALAPQPMTLSGIAMQCALFVWLLGWHAGGWMAAGTLAGYVYFEWAHYGFHFRRPITAYGRSMRLFHAYHDTVPTVNFAISSPLWDLLLGTYKAPPPDFVPGRTPPREQ